MTDAYGVIGHPVTHSKSPLIHARFAEQTAQSMSYERFDVEPGRFTEAVARFRQAGGRGLNVTLPFKEEAWALATVRSARAGPAGAVNTLRFDTDGVFGDNTDGIGIVRDMVANHGWIVRGRRLLMIGAGGASRGALPALLEEQPAEIVVANRTHDRALALCRHFAGSVGLRALRFHELPVGAFDVVINATAASLHGEMPPVSLDVLAPDACCYDMMYATQPTAFLRWAGEAGAAEALDGLGMLVEQAAESFEIWRGVRPGTAEVIAELRRGLRPA
jgi:shikimate dehydrogenase